MGPASIVDTYGKFDNTREQGFRIKKMRVNMQYVGKTDGEGPLIIGFCDADLTAGEVSEYFASDPQSEFGTPAMETVKRHVYPVWVIQKDGTETVAASGKIHYTSIRYPWKEIPEGAALQVFAHAPNDTMTTGMSVFLLGVIVQEWLDD